MGDYATYLVPERCRIDAPEREELARRMVDWLQDKGWIEREKSECVLSGDGNGWRFTPEGARHMADADHEDLVTYGFCVETHETKGVFTNYEGGLESARCPVCGAEIVEDFYDLVEAWYMAEDWPPVTCPVCGKASDIRTFMLEPTWGFSQIGFGFWNLHEDLTEDFVAEFSAVLGEPVRVVEVAL